VIENLTRGGRLMLDEESFTQLLSAAYVMQEHQRQVTSRVAPADLTQILTQIVETQHQIRGRQLPTSTALELIVDRLQRISGAAGAAIGLLENNEVHYKAGSGTAAFLVGCQMGVEASLAAECLKSGEVVRSAQARSDTRMDAILRERLRAQSLLGVPVHLEGRIAGAVELYFSQANAFGEGDVRACELMAGLVTEVMTQALQDELKHELATERHSVLMALEKLKPQLQKLAAEPETVTKETTNGKDQRAASTQAELCRACGNNFVGNETYCGVCGASRASGKYPGTDLQSKWATLWEQQVSRGEVGLDRAPIFRRAAAAATGSQRDSAGEVANDPAESSWEDQSFEVQAEVEASRLIHSEESTSLARWPSEVPALPVEEEEWSEVSTPAPTGWGIDSILRDHAGDIALGLAGLVLLLAVVWGVFAQRSATSHQPSGTQVAGQTRAARHPQRPGEPQLTFFERTLVSLGLAEAPPAPVDRGNPDAKVWVDLGTALYYCQGDTPYGSTPKGKFTSQFDAQQDAFEPAYRKVCE
jgi:GAF domain-containing protein